MRRRPQKHQTFPSYGFSTGGVGVQQRQHSMTTLSSNSSSLSSKKTNSSSSYMRGLRLLAGESAKRHYVGRLGVNEFTLVNGKRVEHNSASAVAAVRQDTPLAHAVVGGEDSGGWRKKEETFQDHKGNQTVFPTRSLCFDPESGGMTTRQKVQKNPAQDPVVAAICKTLYALEGELLEERREKTMMMRRDDRTGQQQGGGGDVNGGASPDPKKKKKKAFVQTGKLRAALDTQVVHQLQHPEYQGLIETVKRYPNYFQTAHSGMKVTLTVLSRQLVEGEGDDEVAGMMIGAVTDAAMGKVPTTTATPCSYTYHPAAVRGFEEEGGSAGTVSSIGGGLASFTIDQREGGAAASHTSATKTAEFNSSQHGQQQQHGSSSAVAPARKRIVGRSRRIGAAASSSSTTTSTNAAAAAEDDAPSRTTTTTIETCMVKSQEEERTTHTTISPIGRVTTMTSEMAGTMSSAQQQISTPPKEEEEGEEAAATNATPKRRIVGRGLRTRVTSAAATNAEATASSTAAVENTAPTATPITTATTNTDTISMDDRNPLDQRKEQGGGVEFTTTATTASSTTTTSATVKEDEGERTAMVAASSRRETVEEEEKIERRVVQEEEDDEEEQHRWQKEEEEKQKKIAQRQQKQKQQQEEKVAAMLKIAEEAKRAAEKAIQAAAYAEEALARATAQAAACDAAADDLDMTTTSSSSGVDGRSGGETTPAAAAVLLDDEMVVVEEEEEAADVALVGVNSSNKKKSTISSPSSSVNNNSGGGNSSSSSLTAAEKGAEGLTREKEDVTMKKTTTAEVTTEEVPSSSPSPPNIATITTPSSSPLQQQQQQQQQQQHPQRRRQDGWDDDEGEQVDQRNSPMMGKTVSMTAATAVEEEEGSTSSTSTVEESMLLRAMEQGDGSAAGRQPGRSRRQQQQQPKETSSVASGDTNLRRGGGGGVVATTMKMPPAHTRRKEQRTKEPNQQQRVKEYRLGSEMAPSRSLASTTTTSSSDLAGRAAAAAKESEDSQSCTTTTLRDALFRDTDDVVRKKKVSQEEEGTRSSSSSLHQEEEQTPPQYEEKMKSEGGEEGDATSRTTVIPRPPQLPGSIPPQDTAATAAEGGRHQEEDIRPPSPPCGMNDDNTNAVVYVAASSVSSSSAIEGANEDNERRQRRKDEDGKEGGGERTLSSSSESAKGGTDEKQNQKEAKLQQLRREQEQHAAGQKYVSSSEAYGRNVKHEATLAAATATMGSAPMSVSSLLQSLVEINPAQRASETRIRLSKLNHERFTRTGQIEIGIIGKGGGLLGRVNAADPPFKTKKEFEKVDYIRAMQSAGLPYKAPPGSPSYVMCRPLFSESPSPPPIPELKEYDEIFSRGSLFKPSDVANALVQYMPTFFVETRYFFGVLPMGLKQTIFPRLLDPNSRGLKHPGSFFKKYSMLFEVNDPRYSKVSIRLNGESSVVTKHPDYGKGDAALRQHSQSMAAQGLISLKHKYGNMGQQLDNPPSSTATSSSVTVDDVGGVAADGKRLNTDIRIFNVLVKNLPRDKGPTTTTTTTTISSPSSSNNAEGGGGGGGGDQKHAKDPQRIYSFFSLVEWINSFSGAELELLNSVPQERVLTILLKYPRIFQLAATDGRNPHLYMPSNPDYGMKRMNATARVTGEADEEENDSEEGGERNSIRSPDDQHEGGGRMTGADGGEGHMEEKPRSSEPSELQQNTAATTTTSERGGDTKEEDDEDAMMKKRTASFKATLEDDLVGVDDLLLGNDDDDKHIVAAAAGGSGCGSTLKETFDLGDKAVEYTEEELLQEEAEEGCGGGGGVGEARSANLSNHQRMRKHQQQRQREELQTVDEAYFISDIDSLLVRRRPPYIAPRSLSNLDFATTADPDLLREILKHVCPPPCARKGAKAGEGSLTEAPMVQLGTTQSSRDNAVRAKVWRWIPIERVYNCLPPNIKASLKQYRGLANFIRLHGKIFEVSNDKQHVISHDVTGRIPPFIPTVKSFEYEDRVVLPDDFDEKPATTAIGEIEREKFKKILGDAQLPTSRVQLLLLDPDNQLADSLVLSEEVADFLPDHPVPLDQLGRRIPKILKAALPQRFNANVHRSPFLTAWEESGKTYIEKSPLFKALLAKEQGTPIPSTGDGADSVSGGVSDTATERGGYKLSDHFSTEDVVELMRGMITHEGGSTLTRLLARMPIAARKTVKQQASSLDTFLASYPQFFVMDKDENNRTRVYLTEHIRKIKETTTTTTTGSGSVAPGMSLFGGVNDGWST